MHENNVGLAYLLLPRIPAAALQSSLAFSWSALWIVCAGLQLALAKALISVLSENEWKCL